MLALKLMLLGGLALMLAMPAASANPRVAMKVEGRGTVVIELFIKEAPKTVANFLKLTEEKFFDGIAFHRVVPNFVAQAGDPKSRDMKGDDIRAKGDGQGGTQGLGAGGSKQTVEFEENELKHDAGTLSMALTAPKSATGTSQFFINLKDNHRLNGSYCVFGKVVEGMDVVMKIERGDKIESVRLLKSDD